LIVLSPSKKEERIRPLIRRYDYLLAFAPDAKAQNRWEEISRRRNLSLTLIKDFDFSGDKPPFNLRLYSWRENPLSPPGFNPSALPPNFENLVNRSAFLPYDHRLLAEYFKFSRPYLSDIAGELKNRQTSPKPPGILFLNRVAGFNLPKWQLDIYLMEGKEDARTNADFLKLLNFKALTLSLNSALKLLLPIFILLPFLDYKGEGKKVQPAGF